MSLNPNTRTACLETLLNETEDSGFRKLCAALGMTRSARNRMLINRDVQTNGIGFPPPREPGACRGVGRQASRGHGFQMQRRQV